MKIFKFLNNLIFLALLTTVSHSGTARDSLSENIKLLELDTDFVATRKQDNATKFIEIDDAFTMGASDNHEHKIIEINIIDRKNKDSVPSQLFITTKVSKEPTKKYDPSKVVTSSVKKDGKNLKPPVLQKIIAFNETFPEMSNETTVQDLIITQPKISNSSKVSRDVKTYDPSKVFTSSVKKDGKNLQPPVAKIMAFNTTFPEMSSETTVQDIILVQPKISELKLPKETEKEIVSAIKNISKHALDVVIPERILQQEIETRRQQEASFQFQSNPKITEELEQIVKETNPFPEFSGNKIAVTTDFGAQFTDNDEFNSEVPPSHKHRGRLLTRSPHHNYYPYFFSRVLG